MPSTGEQLLHQSTNVTHPELQMNSKGEEVCPTFEITPLARIFLSAQSKIYSRHLMYGPGNLTHFESDQSQNMHSLKRWGSGHTYNLSELNFNLGHN